MSGNLVKLAQRFVRLSGELHATRDAMRRLLLNGAGSPNENPTPARRPGAKRPQSSHPKAASGGSGRRDDPQAPAIVAGNGSGGDRQGDGGAKVDDGRALEAPSGEGTGRARRRRVASAGLTAEEIADLLKPGPALQCERWVKPLMRREATSSARFG